MGCPRPNTPRSNPYDLGELEKDLRDRLYTLFHDAPTHGLTLVSGYRDPGRQWDLRTPDRGIPAGEQCNPRYTGRPATAIPAQIINGKYVGGSHHQHRKAADIGGRELQWAIDNRARYGLGLTVRSENWHYETQGIDKRTGRAIGQPTVRILEYPGPSYDDPIDERFFVNDADVAKFNQLLDAKLAPVITEQRAQAQALAAIHRETVQSIPPDDKKGVKASGRYLLGRLYNRSK